MGRAGVGWYCNKLRWAPHPGGLMGREDGLPSEHPEFRGLFGLDFTYHNSLVKAAKTPAVFIIQPPS